MMTIRTFIAPSRIHGIGIFAAKRIPEGTLVWKFHPDVDRTLTEEAIRALPLGCREQIEKYSYFSSVYQAYVLCGDDARFFNHSVSPNCRDYQTGDEEITVAGRDIEAGEELTSDYATFDARHRPDEFEPGEEGRKPLPRLA